MLVLVKSNFIELVKIKVNGQQSELTQHYYNMVMFHVQIEQTLPFSSVLFIGDSITQGLAVSAVVKNAVNYGIGNDTTFGVIKRLSIYKSIPHSKGIVLAIGHNDLRIRSVSRTIDNFKLILDSLPIDKNVILSAVLPIDETATDSGINNRQIIELNKKIEELSRAYVNVKFLNISEHISLRGNLLRQYHVGDGVHLSKLGYTTWIAELKKVIKNDFL